jgi:hypothetical protein
MALHIAKDRPPLVYTWPLEAVTAGTTWSGELKVWNADGTPADLTGYAVTARVCDWISDYGLGNGVVDYPTVGLIRWTFDDASLSRSDTDVYRFTLDATLADQTQRLMDCRLPVRGLDGRNRDYA